MSIIQIKNLGFSYGSEQIFKNADLTLDSDWKLAFTGRNGRGKTTFLKILTGELQATGAIISNVQFEYFPYSTSYTYAEELFSAAAPLAQPWQYRRELFALGLREESLYTPFDSLSEGEKTKIAIAAMFLKENAFLLIDEPTNHLDMLGRKTLASYLSQKSGFIIVSHDRAFLDECCDHVLALTRTGVEIRKGSFSQYLADTQAREENERTENKRLQTEIAALKQSAHRTKEWGELVEQSKSQKVAGLKQDKGHVGAMAAKMMKRAKAIERQKERAADEKRALLKDAEFVGNLKFSPLFYRSEKVCEFSRVSFSYGERDILHDFSFTIMRGDAAHLCGANGSGKSTVFKLITGAHKPDNGKILLANDVKISYVPQSLPAFSGTPAEFAAEHGADVSLFLAILNKLDFQSRLFRMPVNTFSDGQKKKAALAASLAVNAHLYLWDEPLNYLDVISRIQIQNVISECRPTLLFIEHDAAFCSAVATKTIAL